MFPFIISLVFFPPFFIDRKRKETSKPEECLQILSNFQEDLEKEKEDKRKSPKRRKGLDGELLSDSTISMVPVTTSTILIFTIRISKTNQRPKNF